ncbi:hypothetical protein T492DRAFT_309807 [Pavlovales sp. CCMP2436]|nr:hypothetical protein T492DRAFT_309807 [Pavlovales sp. CCMP2436]
MVTVRYEGLSIDFPEGVEVEFAGGALRLHAVNCTGTFVIRKPDTEHNEADAHELRCLREAQLGPLSAARPRAGKRSPDSGPDSQLRTERAVRSVAQKLIEGPPLPQPFALAPNGPLSPQSDDGGDTRNPMGSLEPRGTPRVLSAAWSDAVSGLTVGPTVAAAAETSRLVDNLSDSLLDSLPLRWRWTRLEFGDGPQKRWGHSGSLVVSSSDQNPGSGEMMDGGDASAKLFVFGGEGDEAAGDNGRSGLLADLWCLDLNKGAWERKRDATSARTWHSCCYAALSKVSAFLIFSKIVRTCGGFIT